MVEYSSGRCVRAALVTFGVAVRALSPWHHPELRLSYSSQLRWQGGNDAESHWAAWACATPVTRRCPALHGFGSCWIQNEQQKEGGGNSGSGIEGDSEEMYSVESDTFTM